MTVNALFLLAALTCLAACNDHEPKTSKPAIIQAPMLLVGDRVSTVDGEIRGIFQGSKNTLWFASNGNGVYKYDGTTIINFTEKHGLSSNYVWMVTEGKDGRIWFKTYDQEHGENAICNFDGYTFNTIHPDTHSIRYDFRAGELLFDHYFDGVSLFKIQIPHNSPIQNAENPIHHYDIYATCLDKSGNAWFGTGSAGICKYDGLSFTWFDNKELGAAVRDIYEDRNGTIWAGNNGDGLFKYNGKEFINFSREKNLHNPSFEKYPTGKPGLMSRVWKISEDIFGNLCVATIDNGLFVYDGKAVRNFTTQHGLSINAIWTIYKDKSGRLWIGTEGDGVFTFDGKSFEKFKL